jgi:hypothetical protein
MYQSLESFQSDANACSGDYYKDDSLKSQKLQAAYRIYHNASGGTKLKDLAGNSVEFGIAVVGRLAFRSDTGVWTPSDEAFPSIDVIMQENLTTMGEDFNDQGSILGAKDWSLLANDAWVLGGIHAGAEFHFASPLRWQNLWSDGGGAMTITAREAICITSSGYQIIRPNPKLEAVALCTDAAKANGASLLSLKNAVLKHADVGGIEQFYREIPEAVKQYP